MPLSPPQHQDFRCYQLLGLNFDAVSLDQTCALIHTAVRTKSKLIFATPNINFIAMSDRDTAFRDIIRRCPLAVVDGAPLLWLGKLLDLPLPERVAGSDLVERLMADTTQPPLRVFFFGGEDDTGEVASTKLNASISGLQSVGYFNPGFGSVESMSTTDIIDTINRADPDFLIVSLGAQKGHQWIEHNFERLNVPVISHLGAVINFVAGRQQRSPTLMRRLGMEWLWRIYQEPQLYQRYAMDAWTVGLKILRQLLPLAAHQWRYSKNPLSFSCVEKDGSTEILLTGSLRHPLPKALLETLEQALSRPEHTIHLNVAGVKYIGPEMAAVLAKVQSQPAPHNARIVLLNLNKTLCRQLALQDLKP